MPKKRDTLTLKQQRLVKGITENLGGKNTKPFREIAQEAGYSKDSSDNPQMILKSEAIKKRLSLVLANMEKAKSMHLAQLMRDDKVDNASLRDNAYVYDILVKNSQLLSGKSTSNSAIMIQISETIAGKNGE
jgi:hypothetical protein